MQEGFSINVFFKSDGECVEKIIANYLSYLLNNQIDDSKCYIK